MKRVLCALLFTLAALPSQAGVILYTDEAAYLAAVGATRTYVDFAGSPAATVGGGSFTPDVTFGSCSDSGDPGSCGTSVFHNSNAITDLGGSAANNGVASLGFRFNLPDVYAFGFNYISGGIGAVNLVATSLALTPIDTSGADGFIGLVSDTPFYGGIAVNAVFPNDVGNDRYFIDDFRINDAGSVPEPASLALLGVALSVISFRRRRSRIE